MHIDFHGHFEESINISDSAKYFSPFGYATSDEIQQAKLSLLAKMGSTKIC